MNNDNIVKIGTALKWRNTFDITKKYYQENVVTACGCVFRCKVLQAQGKSPVRATDDQGHIVYTNTDVWDVLVDMAYYYNFAVDTKKLTKETLDYVKELDKAIQKQQKEIQAIQEDDKDQWLHINAIEKTNVEQQREIDSILDTISCFSEGIWVDTLLWSNETIWDNNKYAITDDLQDQINVLTENHRQDIEDLTEKHDSEMSALAAHIVKQEKIQDDINDYLQNQILDLNNAFSCFSTGIWENDLHWSEDALWDNNKYALTDALADKLNEAVEAHHKDVESINQHLASSDEIFAEAMRENAKEHGLINKHLEKHDEEIDSLQKLIAEHDRQLIELLDQLACFSAGQWDNGLTWSNQALWENSNQMCDTFEDIYLQIAEHLKAINSLKSEIQKVKETADQTLEEINATFDDFREEHEAFRKDHLRFSQEHNQFNDKLDKHDILLAEHQHILESLLYRISILSNGVWDNKLLWNNDSEWTNTDLNGSCHCPEDTEERLDDLQQGLEDLTQTVIAHTDSITECQSDILDVASKAENNSQAVDNHSEQIEEIKETAVKEHRSVAYQFRALAREQQDQDINVAKIGEHFSCYADGIWGDLFIWDDDLLWANQSGVVNEALEDIHNDIHDIRYKLNEANEDIMTNLSLIQANHQLIEENKEETDNRLDNQQVQIDELWKQKSCLNEGEWNNAFFWSETELWLNTPDSLIEAEANIIEHDARLSALENQFSLFLKQFAAQKAVIEQQQEQLETLMDCFTVLNVGKWQNLLLWDNTSKWSDILITEASADGGVASVAVKAYDAETATVSI